MQTTTLLVTGAKSGDVRYCATGRLPGMDLSNQCSPSSAFPGTSLLHCPDTGVGIKQCQAKGKAVLLSLGGAAGAYGFNSDDEARRFAHTIWDLFLGGSSNTRPFDDAILDGVDLDIEGGPTNGYAAFVDELRALFAADTRKQYYVSAAPQCPFPDAYLSKTLDSAWIDMVFVQFYNNYCGTQAYGTPNFNFDQWHNWALTTSKNKNVKLFLGVPASRTAANAGYVGPARLREIVQQLRCKYSTFGGVMSWDISQAYGNFEEGGEAFSYAVNKQLSISHVEACGAPPASPQSQTPPSQAQPPEAPSEAPATAPGTAAPPTTPDSTPSEGIPSSPAPPPTTANPSGDNTETGPPKPPSSNVPDLKAICPATGDPCDTTEILCDGFEYLQCVFGKWLHRPCAPGTACSNGICDFIREPVKTCKELHADIAANEHNTEVGEVAETAKQEFVNMYDPLADGDQGARDEYWAEEQIVPANTEAKPAAADGVSDQTNFAPPTSPQAETYEDADEDKDPFLIDFVALEADHRLALFSFDPAAHQDKKLFRTQVRVRTNNSPISSRWKVSFYVHPEQVVHSTSRGKFYQRGSKVVVVSDPSQESRQNMVVRFVVEGTTRKPNDPSNGDQNVFEGSGFDPSLARFETKPVEEVAPGV
ncbi:Chitinase 1 [Actinomortierella wolfii]|nr:Chitinase 1 [Actinomortierella wolfii]